MMRLYLSAAVCSFVCFSFVAMAYELDPAAIAVTPQEQASPPIEKQETRQGTPSKQGVLKKVVPIPAPRKMTKQPVKKVVPPTKAQKNLRVEPDVVSKSYLEARGGVEFFGGLENVAAVTFAKPAIEFEKVTEDKVLFPYLLFSERIYPTLKISSGRGFLINARPRLEVTNKRSRKSSGKSDIVNEFTADNGELFLTLSPSARFSLTVGQQNFQWGPAEITSPSNWIFKSRKLGDSLIKTPQTAVETRKIARVNVSSGQMFNLVTMAEYEGEESKIPRIYEGRRALLKPEIAWDGGSSYAGLVLGGAERMGYPFIGAYFSLSATQAFSIYFDTAIFRGGDAVKPARLNLYGSEDSLPPIVIFNQPLLEEKSVNHESVSGIRFTHENGLELRFEAYLNSQGMTFDELSDAELLSGNEASSPSSSAALTPLFFEPNQEYRSRMALLLAIRQNEFGYRNKFSTLLRYYKPLPESSGAFLIYNEYSLSDNAVLFLAGGGYHGHKISESSFPQRYLITLGHKYVW